ncbi:EmrB/QacA subfamily drug resistance transporter [Paenibacillus shirakamiensis]|uniref:EmrB/QacA subfamily drug resistance transporter n=1 Tax=Paenibacillus shirakamiensis TaxID=1265935 RepID=A0ABS4JJ88_9BACL|nr:MDR family MFS transporter [Paenibacillus shirakamiensis]MBP2001753.1 EmrB/QacA subfamily drug resistance transporter [Paenibacillus shirakamiensis]
MDHAQKKTKNMGLVLAGLLLGILMASMDNTIVATAMGDIVGKLGGLDKFVWVTSAYMVAEMAGMPIFGKLSDMYGRKKFFVFGIIVFMIGSALCGTATSIVQLSMYRAIQGIGGGALVPIAFTIMFDAVPAEMRGKLGGLFGAVFGLSSIFGPLLGAYLTEYAQWEWIFYINLPLGLLAFVFIAFFYRESHEHSKQQIDWTGAVTLVGAVISLMFALELGGKKFAWDSWQILSLFGLFAVLAIIFVLVERLVKEPIISFGMFKKQVYWSSNLIGIFSGAAFITASVYIPIFIQGVLGGKPTNSGLVLLPMMLGSVVTATMGGFLMNKVRYRTIMIPTLALLLIGLYLLTTLDSNTSLWTVRFYMILIGSGIGASFSVLSNAAMNSVSPRERGAASSTMNFLRSLGMTLGITVFGIVQSHLFTRKLTDSFAGAEEGGSSIALPPGLDLKDPHALLSPEARKLIPPQILDKITASMSTSIVDTFVWAVIPAGLALLAAFFMGRDKMEPESVQSSSEYTATH